MLKNYKSWHHHPVSAYFHCSCWKRLEWPYNLILWHWETKSPISLSQYIKLGFHWMVFMVLLNPLLLSFSLFFFIIIPNPVHSKDLHNSRWMIIQIKYFKCFWTASHLPSFFFFPFISFFRPLFPMYSIIHALCIQ